MRKEAHFQTSDPIQGESWFLCFVGVVATITVLLPPVLGTVTHNAGKNEWMLKWLFQCCSAVSRIFCYVYVMRYSGCAWGTVVDEFSFMGGRTNFFTVYVLLFWKLKRHGGLVVSALDCTSSSLVCLGQDSLLSQCLSPPRWLGPENTDPQSPDPYYGTPPQTTPKIE